MSCPYLAQLTGRPTSEAAVSRILARGGEHALRALLTSQCPGDALPAKEQELASSAKDLLDRDPHPDLSQVRADIAVALRAPRSHDDGSYVPLLIRLSWHCCGTYDATTGTGGSNGSTMRFPAEQNDPENAGLDKALQIVRSIHEKHPWLSFADLSVLVGCVAIEVSGGPAIPFACGRLDFTEDEAQQIHGTSGCPFGDSKINPNGSRLPAADLGPDTKFPKSDPAKREAATIDAVRRTFTRLGFDDKETVALILLGHQYGRCHEENSGYVGSWYGFDPAHWNIYGPGGLGYLTVYRMLHGFKETVNQKTGKRQWNGMMFGGDSRNPSFMMLAVDMALSWDPVYKQHVEWYDRHRFEFRQDAAKVWKKLIELGCPDGFLIAEKNALPECACYGNVPCEPCQPRVM